MISLIEAKNYRCLRYVQQSLRPFQILVGPNASGKTTFLDVPAFLGALVTGGLDAAVHARTGNFDDLLWGRQGSRFELALEAELPLEVREALGADSSFDCIRYQVALEKGEESNSTGIHCEQVLLRRRNGVQQAPTQRDLFPVEAPAPDSILVDSKRRDYKTVVTKKPGGNDNFYPEVAQEKKKRWASSYLLGPRRSALGNLPEDENKFPASTWLKQFLCEGVQRLTLNSMVLRKASPPGQGVGFRPDGSNLPWVVHGLESKSQGRLEEWRRHLATALPDIEAIRTVERPDDKHRYLMLRYAQGPEIPSWMTSDGTLRLMALTLPAYLQGLRGAFLIEEPENGIHPRAIETMYQSLSSMYEAQVLLATHSPVILSLVEPEDVLCFAKTLEGGTDIVPGHLHPELRDWQHETTLGVLLAAGVLG